MDRPGPPKIEIATRLGLGLPVTRMPIDKVRATFIDLSLKSPGGRMPDPIHLQTGPFLCYRVTGRDIK